MPRVNIRQTDPVRYAQVAAEQEMLKQTYSSQMQIARLCPYCSHKVEVLCRGTHRGAYSKCSNCGETVFFPTHHFPAGINTCQF